MRDMTDPRFGEIVETGWQQRILTDDGETLAFGWRTRCHGGEVADRVVLEYRTSGPSGLWFASHDETLSCTCGRPSEDGETCMECIVARSES